MATRFYLPSSGAPAVNPPYGGDAGNWDNTSFAARMALVITPSSTTMTTVADTVSIKTNQDHLYRQGVSDPINAQTIPSQIIKFQIRTQESNTAANLFTSLEIRIVSQDGATVRGTILTLERDDVEWENALVNRQFVSSLTTQVISQANDRIVIEFGQGGDPTGGGNHNDGTMRIGDNGGSDLPENDTDTNDYNPWVLFANTITFAVAAITTPLDTAVLTANGQVLALAPGAVAKLLDTASLVADGQAISMLMGEATVPLDTANLQSLGQAISLLVGETAVPLNTANVVAGGQAISFQMGEVMIPVDTANLFANGQAVSMLMGETTIPLSTAQAFTNGQTITIVFVVDPRTPQIVPLFTAQITAEGQVLSVVPGAVSILLDTAALVAGGQAISLLMGETQIPLSTALLNANGQAVSLSMGAVSTGLSTASITATGQTILIFVMVPDSDKATFIKFRDKRTIMKFRDKRTFVRFRDKREIVQ